MPILFGHPSGNPNSHHAALSHFEAGILASFCVPWMPSALALKILLCVPPLRSQAQRMARRSFPPLARAPKTQGRLGELRRLFFRFRGKGSEGLSYEANDWLMRTMARECRRNSVSAVHSYEDCSLFQFQEAKRLNKACIYDMPIGYYSAWEETQSRLAAKFADWLPPGGLPSNKWVRPEQKKQEMELADLVLAPSSFVKETILRYFPSKRVILASYGVDLDFWVPPAFFRPSSSDTLRFIYAGQCSIRKGIPVLLEAWRLAGLRNATLSLIGSWQLAEERRFNLPEGAVHHDACSAPELLFHYQNSDVFLFPSFFEGFGLVLLEAMACGLPAIATEATAGPDFLDDSCGKVIASGDVNGLVDILRWMDAHRDRLPAMQAAARKKAESCSWMHYRQCVSDAVKSFA